MYFDRDDPDVAMTFAKSKRDIGRSRRDEPESEYSFGIGNLWRTNREPAPGQTTDNLGVTAADDYGIADLWRTTQGGGLENSKGGQLEKSRRDELAQSSAYDNCVRSTWETSNVSRRDYLHKSRRDDKYGKSKKAGFGKQSKKMAVESSRHYGRTLYETDETELPEQYDYAINYGRPGWVNTETDFGLMTQWHRYFGKIKTKWRNNSYSDPSMGQNNASETENLPSAFSNSRARNISWQRALVIVLGLLLLVAVITPIVILIAVKDNDAEPIYGKTDMEVTVTNMTYSAALGDPTSNTYTQTASNFCAEIDKKYNASDLLHNYIGCQVTGFDPDSVIVHFFVIVVSVDNVLPNATTVKAVLISGAVDRGGTVIVQMGVFVFEEATVIVGSVTVISDNPINPTTTMTTTTTTTTEPPTTTTPPTGPCTNVQIKCAINNFLLTAESQTVVTNNGIELFNVTGGAGTVVSDSDALVVLTYAYTTVTVSIKGIDCRHRGSYTVVITDTSSGVEIRDSAVVEVLTSAEAPTIESSTRFPLGQKATITCSAALGFPRGSNDMRMMWKIDADAEPGMIGEANGTVVTEGEGENTCGVPKTILYTFIVKDEYDGAVVNCITSTDDGGDELLSTDVTVAVVAAEVTLTPVGYVGVIGEDLEITCTVADVTDLVQISLYLIPADDTSIREFVTTTNVAGTSGIAVHTFTVGCTDKGQLVCEPNIEASTRAVISLDVVRFPENPTLNLPLNIFLDVATANEHSTLANVHVICRAELGFGSTDEYQLSIESNITGNWEAVSLDGTVSRERHVCRL